MNLTSGLVTTLAGSLSGTIGTNNNGRADGFGTAASFNFPCGVAVDKAGRFAVVVRSSATFWSCGNARRFCRGGWSELVLP